ncbi:DUF190 domain-containing protein [Streptomyces sp. ISL-12]|nr:DUF190 domain-containing protein [Streptomyces sp. ISL-12]
MADDLPVAVVIVDTEERVQAFLPRLEEMNIEGLIPLEPVRVVRAGSAHRADRVTDSPPAQPPR